MPTTDRVYFTNQGRKSAQYIDESAIPYAQGTQAYYDFIRDRRNQVEGRTYQKSQSFINAEQQQQQDKVAPDIAALDAKLANPDLGGEERKQVLRDKAALQATYAQHLATYQNELAAYNSGLNDWNRGLSDQEKANDYHGKTAQGYEELKDPWGQTYYRSLTNTSAPGKVGGVGTALAPGESYDNSWNLADGNDVRTGEQKFYDRTLGNFNETADANGKYSWYATEQGYDPTHPEKARTLNLDELANRTWADPSGDSPSERGYYRPQNADWSGNEYWDYNQANSKGWFDSQIRQRANASPYARSGAGGYY